MKELSLHLLDVVNNSLSAGAKHICLTLDEDETGKLTITITDDGRGMSPEFLARVTDPFTTTRTTRNVGLGLPLYRMAAEQTGGSMEVESELGVGTTVTAVFHRNHVDCAPLGDMASTVATLIQGSPNVDLTYRHSAPAGSYELSTAELREILGEDVPLSEPQVYTWLRGYLTEQETAVGEEL